MDLITVITPVAPYHTDVVQEAQASIEASSIQANWMPIYDDNGNGPGWARNQGVIQSTTPYIFFLDADDILQPDALLHAIEAHVINHYTYGDWIHDQKGVQVAPDCYEWDTKSHVVSTLMHRDVFRAIGGFNESIDFEDSEFYLRAISKGVCGVHSPHPFIAYRQQGKRSIEAKESPSRNAMMSVLRERYKGMSCCGDAQPTGPANVQQEDDILVQAQWDGNKATYSTIDGRQYPRTSKPKLLYVSAHDAAAGVLRSATGNVKIQQAYAGRVEPEPDFEILKARLRKMTE